MWQITVIFHSTCLLVLQVIQYKNPQLCINIVYICKLIRKLLHSYMMGGVCVCVCVCVCGWVVVKRNLIFSFVNGHSLKTHFIVQ